MMTGLHLLLTTTCSEDLPDYVAGFWVTVSKRLTQKAIQNYRFQTSNLEIRISLLPDQRSDASFGSADCLIWTADVTPLEGHSTETLVLMNHPTRIVTLGCFKACDDEEDHTVGAGSCLEGVRFRVAKLF